MRGAVLVCFSRGQPFNEASVQFNATFSDVTRANFEIKCKTGGDSARVEFKAKPVQLFQERHTVTRPTTLSRRSDVVAKLPVRQGRSPTEQNGNLLAILWNVAHDFVNQRFANMDGASPASSADRPNAATNLVDEASGISVPLFEVFYGKCSTAFKVLDTAKLPVLTSLEEDCACVPLSLAATRQKTSETRYLYFKWLCGSCDTIV